jgi:hypothetical protein
MTPAPLRLLATWLALAIILGLMAWRLWRHGQTRFSALEAALFTRTAEGWMGAPDDDDQRFRLMTSTRSD